MAIKLHTLHLVAGIEYKLECNCTFTPVLSLPSSLWQEKGKLLKQTDHYTLSSDEESNGTTITKTKAKRQVVKRVTRASVTPSKKIVKNEPIKSSYNLRSGTAEYSSEDESIFSITRNSRKTRMSLSESKIKRQMAILKKDIHSSSQPRTSTPQKSPSKSHETTSSPSKLRATKKLVFESTKSLRARAADIPPMMTRRRRKQETEASIVEEAPPISNDLKITQPPERSPKKVRINESVIEEYQPNKIEEEDQCFPVTWAEFALAAFVTGLAGLGYLCSSTDFCSYC